MLQAALLLLVAGWVILLLQVVHVLPASLFISFLAHGFSFVGVLVGLIGIVMHSTYLPPRK